MSVEAVMALLGPNDPLPFTERCPAGASDFVILVDHASARIPRVLGSLGLPPKELTRHIAWDIGALAVAERVSDALDAPLVAQNYSRLVIDANRDPAVESSIPLVSERTPVPGNQDLSPAAREARRVEIFEPYHARIRALLDERAAAGRRTILLAQHSMTNVYLGAHRAMHAAILYNRDRRFAGLLLDILREDPALHVADNEPYFVSDATDYTVPRHAESRGIPYVELELRQDLVSDEAGQREWAERLSGALREADQRFAALFP